jgi:acetyltransferase
MLESLRSWPLLNGYRGKPRVDIDRLIEVIMRLSYLVADYGEIRELDINPLMVTPQSVVALDARMRLDRSLATDSRPYSHLAIRPYPDEYVGAAELRDGTRVVFRPIKPEDEPAWKELLASCSDESIRMRFRALLKRNCHEVATRYCFIDYDREMSIVAELQENGANGMIGVGNLCSDQNREAAEFAILVADAWQGKGVGHLLTEYCIRIAHDWGLQSVYAETSRRNRRMVSLFEKQGFDVRHLPEDALVVVNKSLELAGSPLPR